MEQQRWAAAAFDAVPNAMVVVAADGQIALANAHAEQMFGRGRSELVGKPLATLLAAESGESAGDELARVLAAPHGTPVVRVELYGIAPNGARFPVELSLGALDGDCSLAVVSMRDLAEQRRAELERSAAADAALAERARLEAALECAPAFIVALSATGKIDFINRTLPQYTRAQVIGLHGMSFFQPDQQVVMEAKLRTMYASKSVQLFEIHSAGPDGRPVWFETQLAPIHGADSIVGAILVAQDITERKRTQAELLASRHMALLGTLAAGVAHEINTPIQFVRDSVEFLRDSMKDLFSVLETLHEVCSTPAGEQHGSIREAMVAAESESDLPYLRDNLPPAFERCVEGLNRISKIVRSLKDFAHPSEELMAPADLNRLVENALTIATSEYKFVATVETHFGDLPPISCHAAEIGQVVLNIVVNAAHAIEDVVKDSGRKGLITVETRYEDDAALITIHDTGTGIPEAVRSRIFDPFFTTKEVGKGTGQGLSIAWSMVNERHGGALTYETEIGQGTTFLIRLPNAPARSVPALAEGTAAHAAH